MRKTIFSILIGLFLSLSISCGTDNYTNNNPPRDMSVKRDSDILANCCYNNQLLGMNITDAERLKIHGASPNFEVGRCFSIIYWSYTEDGVFYSIFAYYVSGKIVYVEYFPKIEGCSNSTVTSCGTRLICN